MRPGRTTSERNKSQRVLRGVTHWLRVRGQAAGRGGRGANSAACPTVNLAPGVAETSLVARPRVSPVGKLQFTNASRACGLCVFPIPTVMEAAMTPRRDKNLRQ